MADNHVIGAAAVEERIKLLPRAIRARVLRAVKIQTFALQAAVKENLSGPVLHVQTGRLRRSIHATFTETENSISGRVGTNVSYGRVHEFGGAITVREHLRMMTMAWGRAVKNPREIRVSAHVAQYPKRSFLRTALNARRNEILNALRGALSA